MSEPPPPYEPNLMLELQVAANQDVKQYLDHVYPYVCEKIKNAMKSKASSVIVDVEPSMYLQELVCKLQENHFVVSKHGSYTTIMPTAIVPKAIGSLSVEPPPKQHHYLIITWSPPSYEESLKDKPVPKIKTFSMGWLMRYY
jgi:hypothetical protein